MTVNILVIDDDELVRNAYAYALEDAGYNVHAMPSGEEGIEELKKGSFDLVFLDLKMPGMNGVETLRIIRSINEDIPVYIVSGFHSEYISELEEIKNEGIHFEIAKKPLNRDQLLAIVKGVCTRE